MQTQMSAVAQKWILSASASSKSTGATSQTVEFGDAPGHLHRCLIVGLGLERKCLPGSRPIKTAREPRPEVRHRRKVHVDGAANNGGDVEIGHREIDAAQIFLLGDRR